MKKMKRILALSLSAVLLLALLASCGGGNENADVTINLNDLWSKIEALGEMPMLGDTPEEILADGYGIDPADLEGYISKSPMMNVQSTEFFIAKVKDGKMDAVKNAILARKDAVASTFEHYLVDQYDLVQNYKLTVNGNYIFFAISEYAEQAEKLFNDAITAAKS